MAKASGSFWSAKRQGGESFEEWKSRQHSPARQRRNSNSFELPF